MKTYKLPLSSSAGFFSDGSFVPSEEGSKLLDYFKDRYNVPIEVQPVPVERLRASPGLRGYFNSLGTNAAGYGGSLDPNRRVVAVNPDAADIHTLAHEAGHAYDPVLLKSGQQIEKQRRNLVPNIGGAAMTGQLTNPSDFLNTYIDFMGPRNVMHTEVTAQKSAAEFLKDIGSQHPERDQPWFQGYPKSFIDTGIGSATALMTIPNAPEQIKRGYVESGLFDQRNPFGPDYVPDFYGNVVYEPREDRLRRVLNLSLDPSYQKAVSDIERRTQTYLDRQLGKSVEQPIFEQKGMSYWGGY